MDKKDKISFLKTSNDNHEANLYGDGMLCIYDFNMSDLDTFDYINTMMIGGYCVMFNLNIYLRFSYINFRYVIPGSPGYTARRLEEDVIF